MAFLPFSNTFLLLLLSVVIELSFEVLRALPPFTVSGCLAILLLRPAGATRRVLGLLGIANHGDFKFSVCLVLDSNGLKYATSRDI